MIVPVADIINGFLILGRVAGLFMFIPVFAGKNIPMQMRAGIAMAFTILILPTIDNTQALPTHFLALGMLFAKELLFGVLMGMAARIAFWVAEFAGAVMSNEIGLSMSSNFDPISQRQSTLISTLLFYLTMLLFFITGIHHDILMTLVLTFRKFPLTCSLPSFHGVEGLVRGTGLVFMIGVQTAAPIIALNFVISLTFAILGKAVPKMNVFMLSFSIRILAGMGVFLFTISLIIQYLSRITLSTPKMILDFLTR